jgi:hypothetical protein
VFVAALAQEAPCHGKRDDAGCGDERQCAVHRRAAGADIAHVRIGSGIRTRLDSDQRQL